MISLIVALTIDRVIGINNTMPWCLPIDMEWFKYNTLNKPIIMGRKTFDSIGKPLPNRQNIIMSRNPGNNKNVTWIKTLQQVQQITTSTIEVMVIGGSEIYNIFLPYATRLYLTHIDAKIYGNILFPNYDLNQWYSIFKKFYRANNKNIYNCYFEILERR